MDLPAIIGKLFLLAKRLFILFFKIYKNNHQVFGFSFAVIVNGDFCLALCQNLNVFNWRILKYEIIEYTELFLTIYASLLLYR